jgi:HAD superfamily hydrolase (TIGR01458 family)
MSKPKIRAVLIDLSGTVHVDEEPIKGSIEAIKRLLLSVPANHGNDNDNNDRNNNGSNDEHSLHVRFVTNTSKESSASLRARLGRLGLSNLENTKNPLKIFSSLTAARSFLISRALRPLLLLSEDSLSDFADISTENPNAVVVGLAPTEFNYPRLNEAFRLLMTDPAATLIAVNKSRYMKVADNGGLSLGAGAFVSALEFSSGRSATVIGKPSRAFFQTVLNDTGCSPEEAVMIGDDLMDDVGGAQVRLFVCFFSFLILTDSDFAGCWLERIPCAHRQVQTSRRASRACSSRYGLR